MGRPRKTNAVRDESGKSRDHERQQRLDYESRLARRAIDLQRDGIDPGHAADQLAGFTLGRLFLRHKADKLDPSGISQRQYTIGQRLARIIHRHARLHGYSLNVRSQAFIMVGGQDCALPPTESQIMEIREEFTISYNAIMAVCRKHGIKARDIVYGACVENWPLHKINFGLLRITLNAVGKELAALDKSREQR